MKIVGLLIVFMSIFSTAFALECPPKSALTRVSGSWVLAGDYSRQGWQALNYIDYVGLEAYTDIQATMNLNNENSYAQAVVIQPPNHPRATVECFYRNKGVKPSDIIVMVVRTGAQEIDFDPVKHTDFYPSPALTPVSSYTCVVYKSGDCKL